MKAKSAKSSITNDQFMDQLEKIKKANQVKKRKNSKAKGDAGELEVVKVLNERFGDGLFYRVPRSGAFTGGLNAFKTKNIRSDAMEILSSDLICPSGFSFAVESKRYSNDSVKMHHFLTEKDYEVGEWWKQVTEDADKSNRKPMLVVRLDKSPRWCVVRKEDFERYDDLFPDYALWKYNGEWLAVVDFAQILEKLGADFFGI